MINVYVSDFGFVKVPPSIAEYLAELNAIAFTPKGKKSTKRKGVEAQRVLNFIERGLDQLALMKFAEENPNDPNIQKYWVLIL